ncbi:YceI family protein [Phenylobacterium aquaticum]|uniref:YceI family protein n=1 Tax=Phenylobacterium aquaticum TaxID=1763816 RepID=UPI0026ED1165|nr:YceI family protein [Phenylobacterium aquaticum]
MTIFRPFAALCGLLTALVLTGAAQAACPTGLPPGVYCGDKDPAAALAGTYKLDPMHAGVIARVSHIGYSMSIFRFDTAQATLVWDPDHLDKSSFNAAVDTGSVATNVPGFAKEIAGTYLKSADFPKATFVSTAFRRIDPLHGEIDGQFTLLGKSKPVTFKVELIGAGKGFGHPRLGAQAVAWINPQDYGMSPFFLDPIQLVIDAEFEQTPAK